MFLGDKNNSSSVFDFLAVALRDACDISQIEMSSAHTLKTFLSARLFERVERACPSAISNHFERPFARTSKQQVDRLLDD